MRYRDIEQRLAKLEAANTPDVYGFLDPGWNNEDVGKVRLCGTEECMTLEEWHTRYPHGTLIRVVYGDPDEMEGMSNV